MIPKFNWKPLSDATECALAKFVQPINDLEEMQAKWEEVAQVPFNSANKYQISVRGVRAWSSRILLSQLLQSTHFFMFQLRDSN